MENFISINMKINNKKQKKETTEVSQNKKLSY